MVCCTQNSSPHLQEKRHNESGTVHKLGESTLNHKLKAIATQNARSQCSYLRNLKNILEHTRWPGSCQHSDAVPRGAQHAQTLLKV